MWSSSDSSVASISNASEKGLLNALGVGSTDITATMSSISASVSVSVKSSTIISIHIEPEKVLLTRSLDQQFKMIGTDSDGEEYDLTEEALWSFVDTSVGVISNLDGSKGYFSNTYTGDVNANSTLSASYQGLSSQSDLIVTPANLSQIWINPTSVSMNTFKSINMIAIGIFDDGATLDLSTYVSWESSDSAVAAISNSYYNVAS